MKNKPRDIRKLLRDYTSLHRDNKNACFICGQHRDICQLHHLIPINHLAELLEENSKCHIVMPLVWLCPNHHAYWHLFESSDGVLQIFDNEEYERLDKLKRIFDLFTKYQEGKKSSSDTIEVIIIS